MLIFLKALPVVGFKLYSLDLSHWEQDCAHTMSQQSVVFRVWDVVGENSWSENVESFHESQNIPEVSK